VYFRESENVAIEMSLNQGRLVQWEKPKKTDDIVDISPVHQSARVLLNRVQVVLKGTTRNIQ